PVAQRPPRIAALERELDALRRVEGEGLVAAAGGQPTRAPLALGAARGGAGGQAADRSATNTPPGVSRWSCLLHRARAAGGGGDRGFPPRLVAAGGRRQGGRRTGGGGGPQPHRRPK